MRRGVRVFAAIALTAVVGVSACAKKKPVPPPAAAAARARGAAHEPRPHPPPPPPPAPREAPPRAADRGRDLRAEVTLDELNAREAAGRRVLRLDSAQIGDDAKPVLQKDADWMKRWPSTKVMVEGHADSRGTAEYNLALGERRANAVRDYLVEPRRGRRPDHDRQQGQGSAVLHRRERVLLAAEPPRPLRDHGEVDVRGSACSSGGPVRRQG